jgi:hypothetical protein
VTWEFDLTDFTWKKMDVKTTPPSRRFAHMEYDPVQKRTVLVGGSDGFNYLNDTWLWDGTQWSEIKKNRLDARALAMMWFDPTAKKMTIYGGIGRPNAEDATRRYLDQWQFDGANGWTKMKTLTTFPGERYGAKVLVDPRNNEVRMFGGLRVDPVGTSGRVQVFANDVWGWNGTAWSKVETTRVPTARENFMLAYDHTAGKLVMFGGYAGFYYSDLWTASEWTNWQPQMAPSARRRATR